MRSDYDLPIGKQILFTKPILYIKIKTALRGLWCLRLFFVDCAYRAIGCAVTARNAGIGVNIVLGIAFGDRAYRAVSRASSAGNAGIVDFESH